MPMLSGEALVCFLMLLPYAGSYCNGNSYKTVGSREFTALANIEASKPFSGLRAPIECCAQLLQRACPAYQSVDVESSKLVFKTKTNEKHALGLAKNKRLMISLPTCASANYPIRAPAKYHTNPPPPPVPVPTPPISRARRRFPQCSPRCLRLRRSLQEI